MREKLTLWVLLPIWALSIVGEATIVVLGMVEALRSLFVL